MTEKKTKTPLESRVKSETMLIRWPEGEKEKMAEAAKRQGFDNVSSWGRYHLRKAAKLPTPNGGTRRRGM